MEERAGPAASHDGHGSAGISGMIFLASVIAAAGASGPRRARSMSLDLVKQEGQGLSEDINALVICDSESFEMAGAFLTGVKGYLKRVDALTDPVIESAKQNLAAAREQKRLLAEPAEGAEKILKRKLADYEQAQAARAREEQQRVLQEQQAAQEEADLGASLTDEAAPTEPRSVPAPVFVPPATIEKPRAAGVSFRTDWSGEVTDLMALVKAVAAGEAPLELVQINQTNLNKHARNLREAMNFAGVKSVSKRTVASKAI